METREYRTVDKRGWHRGEWDNEPDKMQWEDEATGLPCLIVRGPVGALCGYVGVPEGHPYYGKDYGQVDVEAHGGVTFAGPCHPEATAEAGICHVPSPGEPDNVWWLGFDCAHAGDFSCFTDRKAMPSMRRRLWTPDKGDLPEHEPPWVRGYDVYRNVEYVKAECANLARQCRDAAVHASGR